VTTWINLLSLPTWGSRNFEITSTSYQISRRLAGPIVECVLQQLKSLSPYVFDQQHAIFRNLIKNKHQALTSAANLYIANVHPIYNIL